jgi:hypothetical protein
MIEKKDWIFYSRTSRCSRENTINYCTFTAEARKSVSEKILKSEPAKLESDNCKTSSRKYFKNS